MINLLLVQIFCILSGIQTGSIRRNQVENIKTTKEPTENVTNIVSTTIVGNTTSTTSRSYVTSKPSPSSEARNHIASTDNGHNGFSLRKIHTNVQNIAKNIKHFFGGKKKSLDKGATIAKHTSKGHARHAKTQYVTAEGYMPLESFARGSSAASSYSPASQSPYPEAAAPSPQVPSTSEVSSPVASSSQASSASGGYAPTMSAGISTAPQDVTAGGTETDTSSIAQSGMGTESGTATEMTSEPGYEEASEGVAVPNTANANEYMEESESPQTAVTSSATAQSATGAEAAGSSVAPQGTAGYTEEGVEVTPAPSQVGSGPSATYAPTDYEEATAISMPSEGSEYTEPEAAAYETQEGSQAVPATEETEYQSGAATSSPTYSEETQPGAVGETAQPGVNEQPGVFEETAQPGVSEQPEVPGTVPPPGVTQQPGMVSPQPEVPPPQVVPVTGSPPTQQPGQPPASGIESCPPAVDSLGCYVFGPAQQSLFKQTMSTLQSEQSLEELFCECGNLVQKHGWAMFVISGGKCLSGPTSTGYESGGASEECINEAGQPCSENDTYCQGEANAMSVYNIIGQQKRATKKKALPRH